MNKFNIYSPFYPARGFIFSLAVFGAVFPAWGQRQCVQLFPAEISIHTQPSAALRDPLMEEARRLEIYDDFKILADLSLRPLSVVETQKIRAQAEVLRQRKGEKESLRFLIESLYEHKNELMPVADPVLKPAWRILVDAHAATFAHIEEMWSVLVRRTPEKTESSLIPLPHPLLIPGARFQEGYYWDSFFAFPALLRTGREKIVRGQIENFLFLLKNYGMIPNGTRDYYLTRSQPPLISQMVRMLVEHELKNGPLSAETQQWLRDTVQPLIKKDYQKFWMNPKTRYDQATGLNHFWDSSDTARPERHSTDKETEIGKTYRDVRAEAESGKDFTDAFDGRATEYGSVMLNSILYQVEVDLAWLSSITGRGREVSAYEAAAQKRRQAMNTHLWDPASGVYRDVHLKTLQKSDVVTADTFLPLHFGVASREQAQAVQKKLSLLERDGGLMSSEKNSGKQWDAPYGWAPHHYFAINGLIRYGFSKDGQRLAQKWVRTVDNIHRETGKVIEKIDAVAGGVPHESGDKYPTQDGFLWTNGVYVWALTDVLNVPLQKLSGK